MTTAALTYRAIACDSDGTLVEDKTLTDKTRQALDRFKSAGGILILATGETVQQVTEFPDLFRFDLVIAENGALLYWPQTKREKLLTGQNPDELIARLEAEDITPDTVGEVIVSCKPPKAERFASAVRSLEDGWTVIRNRDEVMVLPRGIDKATGLWLALTELDLQPDQIVGIGDGQNDVCMIQACGLGVGLKSADPAVNAAADLVLESGPGEAIVELVDRLLSGDLPLPQ